MYATRAIEFTLQPLDWLRRLLLRTFSPIVRPLILDREKRIAVAGSIGVLFSFAATIIAPLWLLALGPIFLGVAHLLADARYLVARPGLHRRWPLWLGIGVPLIWVAKGSWVGFIASVGAILVSRASWRRKLFGLLLVVPLIVASYFAGRMSDIVFVHLHNFVAVAFFFWWTKRSGKAHWWPLGLLFLGTFLIALGVGSPVVFLAGGDVAPGSGMDLWWMAQLYSPEGVSPELGLRFLLMYAFAQSIHYAVWLRLIPEEDRERRTPRTFVQSFRALRQDMGLLVPLLFLGLALYIAGWAFFSLASARMGYLEIARFHGYVELAIIALFWVEKKPFSLRSAAR